MAKLLLAAPILLTAAVPAMAQAQSGIQPVSKAAFGQRIDQEFAAADTNKDGFADRSELEGGRDKDPCRT